jgi:hypothetical protein
LKPSGTVMRANDACGESDTSAGFCESLTPCGKSSAVTTAIERNTKTEHCISRIE